MAPTVTDTMLDDCVRSLLDVELDSFEKLEIVRALSASGAATLQPDLEAACQLPSEVIRETLVDLARMRVVELDGEQRIWLTRAARASWFATLMRCYVDNRVELLILLSSVAIRRVRWMAARTFARALALREAPDDMTSDGEPRSAAGDRDPQGDAHD